MTLKYLRRAAAAACLTLLSHATLARDPDPVPLDLARPLAANAQDLLAVSDAKALRDVKQAALIAFNVEFVTAGGAYAESREIGRSGTTGLSVNYRLVGVSPADLQGVANALHDQFVREATAAGLQFVPPDRLRAAAAWPKVVGSATAAPLKRSQRNTESLVFSGGGLPITGMAFADGGSGVAGSLTALGNLGNAMSSTLGAADLITELGAPVLQVNMRVEFVETQSSSSSLLGRLSGGGAEVKAALGLKLASASLNVAHAAGGSNIALARPLTLGGDAFTEVRDVSSVAGNVGLAVLSMAIGKGGMQQVREKEAVADAARFTETVGRNLGAVSSMMVNRLQAARQ